MLPSTNCETLIQSFEGLGGDHSGQFAPYICPAGIYTVGWGHALATPAGQDIDVGVFGSVKAKALAVEAMQRTYGKQILSLAEVNSEFMKDLDIASAGVSRLVPADTTQSQFDAMVSFSYNVGLGNFRTSTVLKLHNQGNRNAVIASLGELAEAAKIKANPITMPIAFARWSNVNGKYSLGLFRRRATELMVYAGGQAAASFKAAENFQG